MRNTSDENAGAPQNKPLGLVRSCQLMVSFLLKRKEKEGEVKQLISVPLYALFEILKHL